MDDEPFRTGADLLDFLNEHARWMVWENVPGCLSTNGGRDFGAFLGGLGDIGYGFAYRVLDAQYIRVESHPRAVPQRRRRVFVVGYLGDWRPPAAVLIERESLRRHTPPSREAGWRGRRAQRAPTEAERLQGFPDSYTRIPYRGKDAEDCPDGPRYKALGNSMAVPVMAWIGERIARLEAMEGAA
jgi:site-specific DNA-cytosine methylase